MCRHLRPNAPRCLSDITVSCCKRAACHWYGCSCLYNVCISVNSCFRAGVLKVALALLVVVNVALVLQDLRAPPGLRAARTRTLAPQKLINNGIYGNMTCFSNTCGCSTARRPLTIASFTKAWSAHSYGGLGKHADNLYRSLAKIGHTVHVFTTAVRPVRAMDVEVGARV